MIVVLLGPTSTTTTRRGRRVDGVGGLWSGTGFSGLRKLFASAAHMGIVTTWATLNTRRPPCCSFALARQSANPHWSHRRSPRGRDDARGDGTDRAARVRRRAPDRFADGTSPAKRASRAPRPRIAAAGDRLKKSLIGRLYTHTHTKDYSNATGGGARVTALSFHATVAT